MAKPIQIAAAKIALASTNAISKLHTEADAIHRLAAAKGSLKSGGTIVAVKNLCVLTIDQFDQTASQDLQWVLSHTLFATTTTVDRCNSVANRYIAMVGSECTKTLQKTVSLCGDQRHFEITEPEVRAQEQRSRMNISLALDARYSELKFQRARAFLSFVQRLLQVIFRYGHA